MTTVSIPDTTAPDADDISITGDPEAVFGDEGAAGTDQTEIDVVIDKTSGSDVEQIRYALVEAEDCSTVPEYSQAAGVPVNVTATDLNESFYTLCVLGIDEAGNETKEADAIFVTWQIDPSFDTTPPDVPSFDAPLLDLTISTLTYSFNWTNNSDIDDVRIQIATDSGFTNIVIGSGSGLDLGNVETYAFTADRSDGAVYYARLSVADAQENWSDFGAASSSVTIIGDIYGRVYDPANTTFIDGATVNLKDTGGTVVDTTTTATDGSAVGVFRFSEVPITADSSDLYSIEVTLTSYEDSGVANVIVDAGEETNVGTAYLLPDTGPTSGTITGTTVDSYYTGTESPIAGATVNIYNYDGTLADGPLVTDGAGDFTSTTLNPGSYNIKITASGYTDWAMNSIYVDGAIDLDRIAMVASLTDEQIRIILQWGSSPADLDFFVVTNQDPAHGGAKHLMYWGTTNTCYNHNDDTNPGTCNDTTATIDYVYDILAGGFGPEGIFVYNDGAGANPDIYEPNEIYINVQSNADWVEAETLQMRVEIYTANGLIATIPFPEHQATTQWWQVGKIVLADGEDPVVVPKGRLINDTSGEPMTNWDTCGAGGLCWDD